MKVLKLPQLNLGKEFLIITIIRYKINNIYLIHENNKIIPTD